MYLSEMARLLLLAALTAPATCSAPNTTDILIVGSGYSGLTAAKTIADHNRNSSSAASLSFHVLEALDHAGGRTLNVDVVTNEQSVETGSVVELGGEWLAPSHHAILGLAAELGFTKENGGLFHRQYNFDGGPALKIILLTSQGRQLADSDQDMLLALPSAVQGEIASVARKVKAMASLVGCEGPPSQWPAAAEMWDATTYAGWLDSMGISDMAANWLSEFADDAEDTRAMSLLGVLWTYNCSNCLVGDPTEDWWRVKGGSQAPALRLAERFKANITYRQPVTRIARVSPEQLEVTTASGLRVRARHVLLAGLTAPCLLDLDFDPPLPASHAQLLARLPLGTSMKYMVVYDKPWWRDQGYLGKIENANLGSAATGVTPVPVDSEYVTDFNHSVGLAGIHVAGGDFGGNGMGYIDGAVQTGQKAAERIMAAINNRNNYD
eukprot:g3989.t1